LTWLSWSGNALILWIVVWFVRTKIAAVREERPQGSVREDMRRVLPPGIVCRVTATVMILLILALGIQYSPGTPLEVPFALVLVVSWLSMLLWGLLMGLAELRRERKITIGVIRAVIFLLLLSTAAYSIFETGTVFGMGGEFFSKLKHRCLGRKSSICARHHNTNVGPVMSSILPSGDTAMASVKDVTSR
jgi:hypothetical protein